ncbi:MULE domain-containing protein [Aphis craccivora]|uniref:MULE domain-containing protein n=1 Tax=Aphis craccivora TaxID=307492 RepID=A0A6G0WH18_APHCR|nr:MULE domain-containing protein [Aphis craccivora]
MVSSINSSKKILEGKLMENLVFYKHKKIYDFSTSKLLANFGVFDRFHAQIHGCFFHYTQAVYRKVVDVGLPNDYVSSEGDPLIKTIVRRISALPLVPIKQLDDLWLIIEVNRSKSSQYKHAKIEDDMKLLQRGKKLRVKELLKK